MWKSKPSPSSVTSLRTTLAAFAVAATVLAAASGVAVAFDSEKRAQPGMVGDVLDRVHEGAKPLGPHAGDDLVTVTGVTNAFTLHGKAFTLAWTVESNADLPVTVDLGTVTAGENACLLEGVAVGQPSADPAAAAEKGQYRIYPASWRNLVPGVLGFPNTIVIQVSGFAGSAAGVDGLKALTCAITAVITVSDGITSQVRELVGLVTAFPVPGLLVPIGSLAASHDTVDAAPAFLEPLDIQSTSDNFTLSFSGLIDYLDEDDDSYDADYVEYYWDDGESQATTKLHNNELKNRVSGRYTLSDGEARQVCLVAEVYDEDWLFPLDDDDTVASGSVCVVVSYHKIGTQSIDDLFGGLPPACAHVGREAFAGREPSAFTLVACGTLQTSSGWPILPEVHDGLHALAMAGGWVVVPGHVPAAG